MYQQPSYKVDMEFVSSNPGPSSPKDLDLAKVARDNDPQTLFYLSLGTNDTHSSIQDILTTAYSSAVKIEHTVLAKLPGTGKEGERHTIQASWARAIFRVKVLDAVARTTPWLNITRDETAIATQRHLSGDYHHDKLVYQEAIHTGVTAKFPEIEPTSFHVIEKQIAEIMVFGHDKIQVSSSKPISFGFALPVLIKSEPADITHSALRLVTVYLAITKGEDGKPVLESSSSVYQATLNEGLFNESGSQFNPDDLEIGKVLVQGSTLAVVGRIHVGTAQAHTD